MYTEEELERMSHWDLQEVIQDLIGYCSKEELIEMIMELQHK